ncbi:hypothetical protein [Streptomyces sp. AC550_RSS872]|uniref:hypothetical protein n=1 Tax=Streptomyces sp. AC550_RSS872 TaxID=2823689 RepID=UPI001C25D48F|nr:hypothetical protein [Streptomyces sp. AC550_RSS872]
MSGDIGGGLPGPKESPRRPRQLTRARVGWPLALRELKELLYEVYLAAGAPSLDEITGDFANDDTLVGSPSRDTVRRVITDGERPGQQADVVAVATVLARRAAWDVPDAAGRVRDLWVQAGMAKGAGRLISELRGDVRLVLDGGLGVHPALDTGGARDRLGILPVYVPRDHDERLKGVVDAATAGRSGIAVLVGGSSTGKTRALWEAVGALPVGWRLWHPLNPTAPHAALAALPDIAPKTVVWLNEAQHYLTPEPLGEQVAAGLRELLNDPSRAPVLVLGTLWPEHWDTLTTCTMPDRHAGARALLSGHKIDVPDAFTTADLAALDTTDDADPRLTQAAQHAKGTQIAQYLAGVPYLMDRYHAARGATLALIHAAMDARRMGAGLHIPLDWLVGAAPGYLTDAEYEALDDDWLSKALAYATTPCNGIPGILTPVTSSGPRNQRTRRRLAASGRPQYLLADYLDQHGRHHRAEIIPPVDFWTTAAQHVHPADLTALGYAALDRGLYRDAAQLLKHATTHGNPYAGATLVQHLHTLHPTDRRPARWAAAHAALGDPYAVVKLAGTLRIAGAYEQTAVLLARDPAAHAALDNPQAVAMLVGVLREAGAHEQVTALAKRAAAHTPLDNPHDVTILVKVLGAAGAHEQATALAKRAAALDDPDHVAMLVDALRKAGAHEQVTALAKQAAAHTPLDDAYDVAMLVDALRKAGAHEQVTALAKQAAAHAAVNSSYGIAMLLGALRKAGAHEQVTALAKRAAAHAPLDNPLDVGMLGMLAPVLRKAGAHEQVTALAKRAAAHTPLDNPHDVGMLVDALRKVGAHEQVTALAKRAASHIAHAALDNPQAVAMLAPVLRKVGAHEQVTALAKRAAAHTPLDNPHDVGMLLGALREVGAHEQVTALLERDPAAHTAVNNPHDVGMLLGALCEVGAHEQVTVLAERLPPAGMFDLFINHGGHREQFQFGREPDGSAASSWTWNDLD